MPPPQRELALILGSVLHLEPPNPMRLPQLPLTTVPGAICEHHGALTVPEASQPLAAVGCLRVLVCIHFDGQVSCAFQTQHCHRNLVFGLHGLEVVCIREVLLLAHLVCVLLVPQHASLDQKPTHYPLESSKRRDCLWVASILHQLCKREGNSDALSLGAQLV